MPDVHPVLTERECERCRYPISPGYEHVEQPQPEGSNVVVCSLQKVKALRMLGPCKVCGRYCGMTFLVSTGEVIIREHLEGAEGFAAFGGDHEADPGPAPLRDTLRTFFDFAAPSPGGTPE